MLLATTCARPPAPAGPAPGPPARHAPRPPGDRDQDGITDANDGCIDAPEDIDQFEDGDGCPDHDNDGDGVLDAVQYTGAGWTNCDGKREGGRIVDCRDRPESRDGIEDDDGCPEVWTSHPCATIHADITYDPSTLGFAADAVDAALAEIDASLVRAGTVRGAEKFTLDGHAAGQRDPERARAVSERAALAVRDELLRRGFTAQQLEIRAFGQTVPIASDRTAEGRRHDHRVAIAWELCPRAEPLCP